jgi:hypothetical protein
MTVCVILIAALVSVKLFNAKQQGRCLQCGGLGGHKSDCRWNMR